MSAADLFYFRMRRVIPAMTANGNEHMIGK
jgi:hypothetical protein